MFSISTVASSTSMPIASASPPSVITLIVWPSAYRPIKPAAIDSGIEVDTISTLRQLPRNTSTITDTSTAAMTPSRITPLIAPRTNTD